MEENIKLTGIILAAGFSKRAKAFKPLLKYNGKSFLQNIAEKLLPFCNEIIVVTGFNREKIRQELNKQNLGAKIKEVYNRNFSKGMFSSLKAALNAAGRFEWALYHFVDQPFLSMEFYASFINEIDSNYNWIQPEYNSIKGHPILFDKKTANLILNAKDSVNLRELTNVSEIKKKYWNSNFKETIKDVNFPEDLDF